MKEEEILPRPKCEASDADPRVAAILAGSMAAIVAVGLLFGLLLVGRPEGMGTEADPGLFQHGPEARTDIEAAWTALGKNAASVPDQYAWVDRRAGVVQVPIGRAIDLVCAEEAAKAGKGHSQ